MILRDTPVITPLRKRVFPRVAICQPARKMRLYGNEIQLLSTISCFATCDNFWALFCFLSFAFAMICTERSCDSSKFNLPEKKFLAILVPEKKLKQDVVYCMRAWNWEKRGE